jgi:RND family efflux transporter MFP subunit
MLLLPAGCSEDVPRPELLRPVRTETVIATGGARTRTFSGTARAGRETRLSFRVPGIVQRVNVKVGDRVNRGQVLARLEPRDYEIAANQAEAALAQALATERTAEGDLERVRGLYENSNASQSDYEQALAGAQSARAQVDSAREALEGSRRQLGYTELEAPVTGSIAAVDIEVNENIRAGGTVMLLTSGARAEVEVAIPEVLITQVRRGDSVTVTFDALPGRVFDGVLTEVGVAATGAATTFPVTVGLVREDPDVRSGMAADVEFRFESGDGETRILVPLQAVGGDGDERFVYLLEPGGEPGIGVVRRRTVEVGGLDGDRLEILAGLEEGAQVVTAGVRRLSDGQRVKLMAGQEPS